MTAITDLTANLSGLANLTAMTDWAWLAPLAAASTANLILAWALTILKVALGLGFVIFVHELGHFAVAKMCGVKCEKFYLGFDIYGLKLCKFRWGETEYGIGALPLGGYVKMLGQDDNPSGEAADVAARSETAETHDPRSYKAQSVPKRMAIISAGVIMNLIFAVIFAAIAYGIGVREEVCAIGGVLPGELAWQADMRAGDRVLQINDTESPFPLRFRDLMSAVILGSADGVNFKIERDGVAEPFWVSLRPERTKDMLAPRIGVRGPLDNQLVDPPVRKGSEAEKAELKAHDRIVAVDGVEVKDYGQLARQLAQHPADRLKLTVERLEDAEKPDGPTKSVEIELSAVPVRTLGLAMKMGPISAIQKDSAAAEAGVKAQDLPVSLAGEPVGDPLGWPARVAQHAGKPVDLVVERTTDGKTEQLTLPITPREPQSWQEALDFDSPQSVPGLGIAYHVTSEVAAVDPESPAAKAGLKTGDEIVQAELLLPPSDDRESKGKPDSIPFTSSNRNWPALHEALQQLPIGTKVKLTLADKRLIELEPVAAQGWFNPDWDLRFDLERFTVKAHSLPAALSMGMRETRDSVGQVYGFLQRLAAGGFRRAAWADR